MSKRLLRKVVLAALKGETGTNGWIKIDAPGATDKEISLAIMEAENRGLVEARDLTSHDSSYPYEWKLVGPTGESQQFIRETAWSKKVWAVVVTIVLAIVGFFAWLIPILVSVWKK